MLSVGKISEGNKTYHLEQVAANAEDYYSGRGEAPGYWIGAAGELDHGLSGEVAPRELIRLLEGRTGRYSETLFSKHFTRRSTLAFDLTFSAPKSVSLMYAAGDPATQEAVREAHDVAVRAGYNYMETHGAWGRVGVGDTIQPRKGNGLLGAAFRHRTSRLGDPNLHTHVVTPNLVCVGENHWTTLDGRRLYHHAKTGGIIYQATLRRELTQRLGVRWGEVSANAQADLAGFSPDVLKAFSKRRQLILRTLKEIGGSSYGAAQAVTLTTRRGKDLSKPVDGFLDQWETDFAVHGIDARFVGRLCNRTTVRNQTTAAERRSILAAIEADTETLLTSDRAYFDRRTVIQAVARVAPATIGPDALETLADQWIDTYGVRISEQGAGPVTTAQKAIATGNRIVTTRSHLSLEQAVLEQMEARRGNGAGGVDARVLAHGLKHHGQTLSAEQRAMVKAVVTSGNGVDVVIGDAGTGKTFALDTVRHIYEDAGYRVIGGALSARAARELGAGANVESETVHENIRQLREQSERGEVGTNTVFFIDEAAMLETSLLHSVLTQPASSQMKIVLIGDTKQLPAIGAGGVFRSAAERLGFSQLTENWRQRDAIDREIVGLFRDGHGGTALQKAHNNGRLTIADSHAAALDVIYEGWAHESTPAASVMIAGLRSEVYELNKRAQAGRLAGGELGRDHLVCAGHTYYVGDVVRCGARDRERQVVNGDFGRVTGIDHQSGALHVEIAHGDKTRTVTLDHEFVNDLDRFKLGYAITAHTAQGGTWESVWTLFNDRTYRELAYTQASRARGATNIVVVGAPVLSFEQEAGFEPDSTLTELDLVVASLQQSQEQAMAVEVGTPRLFVDVPDSELAAQLIDMRVARVESVVFEEHEAVEIAPDAAEAGQHYRDIINEIHARARARVSQMLDAPDVPHYLKRELGALPDDPAQREIWRRAAIDIEAFRGEWNVFHKTRALTAKRPSSDRYAENARVAELTERHATAVRRRTTNEVRAIEAAPLQLPKLTL